MKEGSPIDTGETPLGIGAIELALAHSHETYVIKTADETVNNSAALQDDNELFWPVLSNQIWDVELVLLYNTNTTADLKWAFTVPGSGTGLGVLHRLQNAAAGVGDDQISQASEAGTAIGGIGSIAAAHVRMLITVGAADGNIVLQWAQNTANLSNTIVQAGSYIIARKVN
jgi:hypothetical protein